MGDKNATYNASIIYDNPNSIFIVGKEGKLETISRFNLLGRFIEWCKDVKSGGERSRRADEAITNTLNEVLDNLKSPQKKLYILDNNRLISRFSPISIFYKQIPVHPYTHKHPVDEFSEKIIHSSSLGNKPEIIKIAEEIKKIASPLISDDLRETFKKEPTNI